MIKFLIPTWLIFLYVFHVKEKHFSKFLWGFIGFFWIVMLFLNDVIYNMEIIFPYAIEVVALYGLLLFYPLPRKRIIKFTLFIIGPLYIFGYNFILYGLKIFLNTYLVYPYSMIVNEIFIRLLSCCFIILLYYAIFTKPHILRQNAKHN